MARVQFVSWFEVLSTLHCNVSQPETVHGRMEASEFRYRKPLICSLLSFEAAACGKHVRRVATAGKSDCLIAISQSGETADTLEALILISDLLHKPAISRLSRWQSIIRPAGSTGALHALLRFASCIAKALTIGVVNVVGSSIARERQSQTTRAVVLTYMSNQ